MPDANKPEKAQAEIPFSATEYTAVFARPILSAWPNLAALTSVVLNALEPFGFNLDGVEAKTITEKLADSALIFRRRDPGVTFTLYLGKLVVTAENLDWAGAEQFIIGMTAGVNAVKEVAKPEIQAQHLGLGMHVQIKTKPRKEVTAPLVSPVVFNLLDGDVLFQGIILQREKSSIFIDASLAYANGLFIRMYREHRPDATLAHLAEALRRDEERLFDILGLEGVL